MLGEAIAMLTPEDVEILHGIVNSITFVKTGLNENETKERDLLNQALIPLRTLILEQKGG